MFRWHEDKNGKQFRLVINLSIKEIICAMVVTEFSEYCLMVLNQSSELVQLQNLLKNFVL